MKIILARGWRGRHVVTVQLPVTKRDILIGGVNADMAGMHLFRGAWYGYDLASRDSYGKIEGRRGLPIGKLSGRPTPYLLRKLDMPARRDMRRPRPASLPPRRGSSYNPADEGSTQG